jgi:hypothetical protein
VPEDGGFALVMTSRRSIDIWMSDKESNSVWSSGKKRDSVVVE